jgi:hypothetical protein
MPALTRRRYPERTDCWHVYYGDVHVGTIAARAGVPVDVDQWGWDCGFYPLSHRGMREDGTAADFETARSEFAAAWERYLPRCTEADFEEYRREEAWTAWKYAMWDAGCRMPTQYTSGVSRCFCGATIDLKSTEAHVYSAHMKDLQDA